MNRMAVLGLIGLTCVMATAEVSAAVISYKNNSWQWTDNDWEGGVKPGPDDTALIPELPILKSRYEAGKMQSNGLVTDENIQILRFSDLYGMTVNGAPGTTLTLNSVICDDMSPSSEETAQVATNKVAMPTLAFKGLTNEFYVGTKHVFYINAGSVDRTSSDSVMLKTGPGKLVHSGAAWGSVAAPVWVQEGVYLRTGNGYPELRGDVIVGGCGKPAEVALSDTAAQGFVINPYKIEIRPLGRISLPGLSKYYFLDKLTVDHGVFDGGSGTTYQMNSANADYVLDGAVLTNMTLVPFLGGLLTIKPSSEMSAIYGSLTFNDARSVIVPDGAAPVDLLISGDFKGLNRGVHKDGAGTMVIRCKDSISTWGGTAGKPFNVYAGELFMESSSTGIGMGTNNVIVAAGATYGVVGRQVGAEVYLRGRWGNVTLNGAEGKTTAFAIGRKDFETGALIPGEFILGSDEQPNDVTFSDYSTLRVAIDESAVSALTVNGTFTIGANNVLAIEGPEDPSDMLPGRHVIVSTKEPMNAPFASVTYNGKPLAAPYGKIIYQSNSIVYRVPERGFSIFFQ